MSSIKCAFGFHDYTYIGVGQSCGCYLYSVYVCNRCGRIKQELLDVYIGTSVPSIATIYADYMKRKERKM